MDNILQESMKLNMLYLPFFFFFKHTIKSNFKNLLL